MAALGKGKILENKHIKIERKKFNLYMRLIAGLGALLVLANAAFEYFCYENATLQVIGVVLWWAGLAALVGLMVFSAVMTDRAALAAEQAAHGEDRKLCSVNGTSAGLLIHAHTAMRPRRSRRSTGLWSKIS